MPSNQGKEGKKMELDSLLPQKGEDASCAFMANQPGDVVERLHSEKRRGEHETEKQKNNSLTQSPHNQGKAGDLPAALIQWFYEETLPGEGRQTRGRRRGKAIILNQSQHDSTGDLCSRQDYCTWLTYSVSPGEAGPRWCSRHEPSEWARLQTRRHIGLVSLVYCRLHDVTTDG